MSTFGGWPKTYSDNNILAQSQEDPLNTKRKINTGIVAIPALLVSFFIQGCGSSSNSPEPFTLQALPGSYTLAEGDPSGIDIPLDLSRADGYTGAVSLAISGVTESDSSFVSITFSPDSLTASDDHSSVNLKLDVGVLPLLPQQRQFQISATDGITTTTTDITVDVTPVNAPDVYLLIGQSNMVGFGGDGDKDAGPGGLDEPHPRILQLNVTGNDPELFNSDAAYTTQSKLVEQPHLVVAEDPLHLPRDPLIQGKYEDYVGLGISFAKSALVHTSQNIVLVPTAWSGSAFCAQAFHTANWNALPASSNSLGNTLLFDRAIARLNIALQESNGIFRGILWHQGETDANDQFPECSNLYQQNLELLVAELRSKPQADARGTDARSSTANIPFVAGTLSIGSDENGDFSIFFAEKQIVSSVLRNVSTTIAHAATSNHDNLTPANGYPCGNQNCIHFGSLALREMGARYYNALRQAASN